jgi:hypothetical protein
MWSTGRQKGRDINNEPWHTVARDRTASSLDRFSICHDPRYLLSAQTTTDQYISSMSCEQDRRRALELLLLVADWKCQSWLRSNKKTITRGRISSYVSFSFRLQTAVIRSLYNSMKWNSVNAMDCGVSGPSTPASEGYGSSCAPSMKSPEVDSKLSVPWYIPGPYKSMNKRTCYVKGGEYRPVIHAILLGSDKAWSELRLKKCSSECCRLLGNSKISIT